MIVAHIIASRVAQFHRILGEGTTDIVPLVTWDNDDEPIRSSAELVDGLESTWQIIHSAIMRWTTADLKEIMCWQWNDREYRYSRRSLVWLCLKHDIHHGGELSLILGIHGLAGFD